MLIQKNDLRSVTLQVFDKKGGPSQILRRPIIKLVLLVENEFGLQQMEL